MFPGEIPVCMEIDESFLCFSADATDDRWRSKVPKPDPSFCSCNLVVSEK